MAVDRDGVVPVQRLSLGVLAGQSGHGFNNDPAELEPARGGRKVGVWE